MRLLCATLVGIAVFALANAWWQPGRFCTGAFAPRDYTAKIYHWEFGVKSYNGLSMYRLTGSPGPVFPMDVRRSVIVAGPNVRIHLAYVLAAVLGVGGWFAVWWGWYLLPPRHIRRRR